MNVPAAEDGRADVFGPLEFDEIIPAMEESLKLGVWDAIVSPEQELRFISPEPDDPRDPVTFRKVEFNHLAITLRNLRNTLFHKPRQREGLGSSSRSGRELSHLEWFGDLGSIDAAVAIRKEIAQATRDHQSFRENGETTRATSLTTTPPSHSEPWEGYWTYLHPRMRIGPQREPTLREAIVGEPTSIGWLPGADFRKIPDIPVEFTPGGYVLVGSSDERRARRALNHLVFQLVQRGIPVSSIGPNDCAGYQRDRSTSDPGWGAFTSWDSPSDPSREGPTTGLAELRERMVGGGSRRFIDTDEFETLARNAWYLSESKWAAEVEWLVDSEGYAAQGRHSASLLAAWTGIERVTYGLLDLELERRSVPEVLRKDVGTKRFVDAHKIAIKLGIVGIPASADVGSLPGVRNGVVHSGKEASSEDATKARELLRQLLSPLLNDQLRSLVRDGSP